MPLVPFYIANYGNNGQRSRCYELWHFVSRLVGGHRPKNPEKNVSGKLPVFLYLNNSLSMVQLSNKHCIQELEVGKESHQGILKLKDYSSRTFPGIGKDDQR